MLFMLVISFSPTPNFKNISERSDSYVLDYLYNSPLYNRDDYTNFTGPPIIFDNTTYDHYYRILIDDTDPDFNWSKTAAENEWCTGSGTWSDPYVIENLYIDAEGIGGIIRIRHSNKYFIIQNNWITNTANKEWGTGILLDWNTSNGIVKDNLLTYTEVGITVRFDSHNNTVSNNIMIEESSPGSHGIGVGMDTSNNTIIDNKMLNFYSGMKIYRADTVIIKRNYMDNTIRSFSGGSVVLLRNVRNSFFVENILAGKFATGSITVSQTDSGSNIVEYNYVSTNQSLVFDFNLSFSGIDDTLLQSQTVGNSFGLEDSYNNYIAYNIALMDSPDDGGDDNGISNGAGTPGIPGFNPILILGIIFIVSLVILKKRVRK